MSDRATDHVLVEAAGGVGRLRLNRPRALHALDAGMCAAMLAALDGWADDPAIALILLDHAADPGGDPKLSRGFCAGGDIRMLAASGAGDGAEARAFFALEYRLNHRLFTYAKPIAAFMDGVTMGGGVGIALPCRYRVATENTRFAMPETGIGLFPDVGGGWYLSRLPGRIGQYLALTGHRLDGSGCVALGLATHYIAADRLERTKAALLAKPDDVDAILARCADDPPPTPLLADRAEIDALFAGDDLAAILDRVNAADTDFARATAATLATKSPLSMAVSLRLLAQGAAMPDFAAEMAQEYAVAARMAATADFHEGVRALIVDKDNAPAWRPASVADLDPAQVDAIFAALPPEQAWTPA